MGLGLWSWVGVVVVIRNTHYGTVDYGWLWLVLAGCGWLWLLFLSPFVASQRDGRMTVQRRLAGVRCPGKIGGGRVRVRVTVTVTVTDRDRDRNRVRVC